MMRHALALVLFSAFFVPLAAEAHQPRIVSTTERIEVSEPEISKAFYGRFPESGTVEYSIPSDKPFLLYVELLLPQTDEVDFSATALVEGFAQEEAKLGAARDTNWEVFHEEFGDDRYYDGGSFESDVSAGTYTVHVRGAPGTPYVFAVGKKEVFGIGAIVNTFRVLPEMKSEYFGKPWWDAFFAPVILFPLAGSIASLLLLILAGILFFRFRRAS